MAKSVAYSPALKREYEDRFARMEIRPNYASEVETVVDRIYRHMDEYRAVEEATGVPAHVVGIIHIREGSGNFNTHLHNGDPLTGRTWHVPAGRPPNGNPPFSWVDSAIDALTMPGQALHEWTDWSIGGTAYALERFNGFGYRLYHSTVPSPYLWGATTEYTRGMYVADGQWDDEAVNRNPGGMAMLKRMQERGLLDDGKAAPAEEPPKPIRTVESAIKASNKTTIRLQQRLDEAGFYRGEIDGDLGPQTRTALLAYLELHHPK